MGGPRPRRWAPVGLRSCFLSGLLGRMGGPRRRGWVFVGLPSCFLSGLLGRMGGPRPRSWAFIGFPSYFHSGRLGRMGGPRPRSWAFIGRLGRMGGPRPWAPIRLPSCFLSGLLGRMGGPRPRISAHVPSFGLPSFALLGCWVGWVGRGQEAPFFLGPGSDASAAAKKLGHHNPSPAKQHKRPKQDPSAHPPGFSHFTLADNGGQGDCAYCAYLAIAIALADTNKAKSKTPAVSQDFEPGGRLQAQLRLLASKELANNPSRYFAPGDDRASTVPSQTASAG